LFQKIRLYFLKSLTSTHLAFDYKAYSQSSSSLEFTQIFTMTQSTSTRTQSSSENATPTTSQLPIAFVGRELSTPAELPPLPYDANALDRAIDAETMQLHHDKHHAAYVKKLNDALSQYPDLQNQSVESLLRQINVLPEEIQMKVRNNGGGHLNHTIFWHIMGPNGDGQPTGAIAEEINQTFGSFDNLKQQFNKAGGDRFGSGWVWLVCNPQGQLEVRTTQNQDNPISKGNYYPILGNDVWEHAYYLRYQNRRADYLNNW